MGRLDSWYIADKNEAAQPPWKMLGGYPKSSTQNYDPATPLLGIYPKELETR
jgi:hypothetical protein